MIASKELKEADEIFSKASKILSFKIINPINEPQARRSFKSGTKNPLFKYGFPDSNLLELKRQISSFIIQPKDFLHEIMMDKQYDLIKKIDLINSTGCTDFTEKSIQLYPKPGKKLVAKAREIIEQPTTKESKTNKLSKDVTNKIKSNLKKFNLTYKIVRDDIVSSCYIEASKSRISLKKKQRFSSSFVNRLIVHEIGVHAFRYENGKNQKLKVFAHGLDNYLETEEGLAVFSEEKYGLLRQSVLRNYAGRVLAVDSAMRNDFYNVYKEMCEFFDKKKALTLAIRAKRGLSNTSIPGGYTKDAVYLRGYLKVKDYFEKGGNLEDIYYGKIGLEHIPVVRSLNLKKPTLIPENFELFEN